MIGNICQFTPISWTIHLLHYWRRTRLLHDLRISCNLLQTFQTNAFRVPTYHTITYLLTTCPHAPGWWWKPEAFVSHRRRRYGILRGTALKLYYSDQFSNFRTVTALSSNLKIDIRIFPKMHVVVYRTRTLLVDISFFSDRCPLHEYLLFFISWSLGLVAGGRSRHTKSV